MNLAELIKNKFSNVEVTEIDHNSVNVEIQFSTMIQSIIITKHVETDRYSASYPALVRDGHGGWKTEDGFAENMLIDGVFWILGEVKKHGKVKPEIVD